MGFKRLAVFYDNDDCGIGLKDAFVKEAEKLGVEIVGREPYTGESIDFTPQLAKFKTLNPDAILISGLYNEAALIASQAKRQGIMTQLLVRTGYSLLNISR